MKKKRRPRKSNKYFTQVHEDAILEYISCPDPKERNIIYRDVIRPAFLEMIDKIVFTYKFTNLPNIDALKEECEVHLVTILSKFDKSRGSKAFSYFSVITKNFFVGKVKKNAVKLKRETSFENITNHIEMEHLTIYNEYHKNREWKEFFEGLWGEIDKWDKQNLKPNERKVLEAIKIILGEPDPEGRIFNKKAIYYDIREITKLNTKQVLNSLNKFRAEYFSFKAKWNE